MSKCTIFNQSMLLYVLVHLSDVQIVKFFLNLQEHSMICWCFEVLTSDIVVYVFMHEEFKINNNGCHNFHFSVTSN